MSHNGVSALLPTAFSAPTFETGPGPRAEADGVRGQPKFTAVAMPTTAVSKCAGGRVTRPQEHGRA